MNVEQYQEAFPYSLICYKLKAWYKAYSHDTIVLAGAEYGSGSSQDWVAKVPMLLRIFEHFAQIRQWKHWEDYIKKDKYDQDKGGNICAVVNKKVTHVHQHAFIREHFLGIGFCSNILSWLGHNVVLISNHQTEAKPMIIALLLETSHPHVAEKMTYVAGNRIVTDPVCKPFSMGRNIVCVYSKKHMHDIPELAEMKKKANTLSLKEMALLLRYRWTGRYEAHLWDNSCKEG
ncbi:uncharacterized protein LOC131230220 [Magnolia sinica]|uniref:uncharacterized protein LOC131230220 n=1 Tax=Magnolia sinica TaxID=86752 RepID=UPI002659E60A|nr:uncharacterized protein LOC131230220 [Magnolia sinica]